MFEGIGSKWIWAMLLALLAMPTITACDVRGSQAAPPPADAEFTIEPGALARQLRGQVEELIPGEIELETGQSIVIHNEDQALHYFLSSPIWPGQTLTKTFDEPGIYRFSGAFTCSVGSSTSLTVSVSDSGAGSN